MQRPLYGSSDSSIECPTIQKWGISWWSADCSCSITMRFTFFFGVSTGVIVITFTWHSHIHVSFRVTVHLTSSGFFYYHITSKLMTFPSSSAGLQVYCLLVNDRLLTCYTKVVKMVHYTWCILMFCHCEHISKSLSHTVKVAHM